MMSNKVGNIFKSIVILTFSLLFFFKNLNAQGNISFKHLTVTDGLSQSAVMCIFQDSKGFMWFGTQDGLNRYDGYNFKVYKNNPTDSTSLSDNFADEVLQWCGRELERGFRTHVFGPVAVARVFLRARARALPGLQIEPPELLATLLAAQAADGGWSAEPEVDRLDATLEAVEALLRLGPGVA